MSMLNGNAVYDLLLDRVGANAADIEELFIGAGWTHCLVNNGDGEGGLGICRTPPFRRGSLPWSGSLVGRGVASIAPWIRRWDRREATVAMAAINAVLGVEAASLCRGSAYIRGRNATQAVFDWFKPMIGNQQVVIVGDIPGIEYQHLQWVTFLPSRDGALDPSCENFLPQAEWVFIADHTLPDKTLPRVLELCHNAQTVLMGPGVPWLEELADFGIDFLVGLVADEQAALRSAILEGVDLFDAYGTFNYRVKPMREIPEVLEPRQERPKRTYQRVIPLAN